MAVCCDAGILLLSSSGLEPAGSARRAPKAADVVAEDLKTGDIVEYEVIEGKPLNVKKKVPK